MEFYYTTIPDSCTAAGSGRQAAAVLAQAGPANRCSRCRKVNTSPSIHHSQVTTKGRWRVTPTFHCTITNQSPVDTQIRKGRKDGEWPSFAAMRQTTDNDNPQTEENPRKWGWAHGSIVIVVVGVLSVVILVVIAVLLVILLLVVVVVV